MERTLHNPIPRAIGLLAILCLLAGCGGGTPLSPVGPGSAAPGTGTVTLEWDTPSGASIFGYKVYYGTAPSMYAQPFGQGVDVGMVNSYPVAGLANATTYYFAVTAYDASNGESPYSNEIFRLIP